MSWILTGIAAAINEMEDGSLSPFAVSERTHKFPHGASRFVQTFIPIASMQKRARTF